MTLKDMYMTPERVNFANLLALLGILVTAIVSYVTLQNNVATLERDAKRSAEVREAAISSLRTQNNLLRDLFSQSQERMAVIETKIDALKEQQDTLSKTVNKFILDSRNSPSMYGVR